MALTESPAATPRRLPAQPMRYFVLLTSVTDRTGAIHVTKLGSFEHRATACIVAAQVEKDIGFMGVLVHRHVQILEIPEY